MSAFRSSRKESILLEAVLAALMEEVACLSTSFTESLSSVVRVCRSLIDWYSVFTAKNLTNS